MQNVKLAAGIAEGQVTEFNIAVDPLDRLYIFPVAHIRLRVEQLADSLQGGLTA